MIGAMISDATRAELQSMVQRVRRRGAWTAWADETLEFLFYAWFVLACLFLVDRIHAGAQAQAALSRPAVVLGALLGVTALGAAGIALRTWLRVPRDLALAHTTDRRFDLADRFSSALDFADRLERGEIGGRPAEFARAQVEDAARFVRVQDPRQVYPARPLGDRWTSLVALLIALWIALLPAEDFRARDPRSAPPEPMQIKPEAARSNARPQPRLHPKPRADGGGGTAKASPASGGGGGRKPPEQEQPESGPGGGDGGGRNQPPTGPQESPEEMFGEPERAAVKTRPEEVQPLFGEGPTRKEDMTLFAGESAGGEPGKSVPLDQPALVEKYRRVAEETLDRERVPPADRDLVRKYFSALGAKE